MKFSTKRNAWPLLALVAALLNNPISYGATFTVTNIADSGPGSLRDALTRASDGDTIDATGVSGTILLTSGELLVRKSVSIVGAGPATLSVDGNSGSRVFHVTSNTVVNVYSLTITNGNASNDLGGGIFAEVSTLTVSNCLVSGNSGTYGGGGIAINAYPSGGALDIIESRLTSNLAAESGGAIYIAGPSGATVLKMVNCALTGNAAIAIESTRNGSGGGAVHSVNTLLIVSNCVLSANKATTFSGGGAGFEGGAILAESSTSILTNSVISGNSAFDGGGILVNGGTLQIEYCIFASNTVSSSGGAIFNIRGNVTIADTTMSHNVAAFGGGTFNIGQSGINSPMIVRSSTVSDNSAVYDGGGVYNRGDFGGGAILNIVNSTISRNTATRSGGGIANFSSDANSSATLNILNSTLEGNSLTGTASVAGGGGIYNENDYGGIATVAIGSTLLDASTGGENLTNASGIFITYGYNISSDGGAGVLTNATDRINIDPMLGALQDNGGPTLTHALLPDSPAIDQGFNFSGLTNDQRAVGFARTVDDPSIPNAPGGDGTDIGAYEVQTVPPPPDSDGDGVPDAIDQCPDTLPGAVVDANGCSIDQLVPCVGPQSGGAWRNHGQYVRAIIQTANEFLQAGLINHRQWSQIVTSAAQSRCGWNPHSDHDGDRDWHRNWIWDHDRNWGGNER